MTSLSHAVRRATVVALLALVMTQPNVASPQEPPPSAASMKAYSETIPGTDVKFDMVPIPGRNL